MMATCSPIQAIPLDTGNTSCQIKDLRTGQLLPESFERRGQCYVVDRQQDLVLHYRGRGD